MSVIGKFHHALRSIGTLPVHQHGEHCHEGRIAVTDGIADSVGDNALTIPILKVLAPTRP